MLLKKLPKRNSFTTDAAQTLETLISFTRPSGAGKNLQVTETQEILKKKISDIFVRKLIYSGRMTGIGSDAKMRSVNILIALDC